MIIYKDKFKIFYLKSKKNTIIEKGNLIGTNLKNINNYANFDNILENFKNINAHEKEHILINNYFELCYKRKCSVIDGYIENIKF